MLATIGKFFIEQYWKKIPPQERRVCLHKVSCSNAVYSDLNEFGFYKGLKTYLNRRKTCNTIYELKNSNEGIYLITKNGSILKENEINPILIKDFKCLESVG